MKFEAIPDKTRFDFYFAADVVDALTAVQQTAAQLKLDPETVGKTLALVAEQFRLEVTP